MNIKIGDLLKISTLNKKNFYEIETFKHLSGDLITVSTSWRTCSFDIKITSNEEALCLSKFLSKDASGYTNLNEFSDYYFDESYDEYERSVNVELKSKDEHEEKIMYEKILDYGVDWILEEGFYSDSIEYVLTLPLKTV